MGYAYSLVGWALGLGLTGEMPFCMASLAAADRVSLAKAATCQRRSRPAARQPVHPRLHPARSGGGGGGDPHAVRAVPLRRANRRPLLLGAGEA